MKKNYTHITVIVDRSGSMSRSRNDVIGGFNAFLAEQKLNDAECTLTLVQFDSGDVYDVLRDFVPLNQVEELGNEYMPRGSTPLYDALGHGIDLLGKRLAGMKEEDRPEKVLFVIITDGEENASLTFTKTQIAAMTKHQTDKYNWQFMYLGANQDAMVEGAKAGISMDTSATYSEQKTCGGIMLASKKMSAYRLDRGSLDDLKFTDTDRAGLI